MDSAVEGVVDAAWSDRSPVRLVCSCPLMSQGCPFMGHTAVFPPRSVWDPSPRVSASPRPALLALRGWGPVLLVL